MPNKGIIKVNESLPTWGFILDSFIFNDTIYDMKIPVIINTALHGMILSEKLESLSESCKRNNTECGNTYSFIIQNTKMN